MAAYEKVHEDWEDLPSTDTPVTAAALEQIESGIAQAQDDADTAGAAATDAAADLATHLNDTSDAHDATAVSVTAIDGVSASNVQTALEEIQGNVVSAGGTVDALVAGNLIDVDNTDPANPIIDVESSVYRQGGTDVAVADGGTGAGTAAGARSNLGLGSMAEQAAGAVAITGGTVTGITDLAVADGGTGASTAAGARTNLGIDIDVSEFNVKRYGATGDGSTDDTVAIQAAIDACAAAGGGTVYFPPGIYVVGGALQDTSESNSQLLLPRVDAVDSEQMSITLAGAFPPPTGMSVIGATPLPDGHSVIKGTLNTGADGALIGAHGPAATFEDFTWLHLRIENLAFRMPSNPVLTALDLSRTTMVDLDNVVVDCGSYTVSTLTEPTTTTSVGIKLPVNNNGAFTRLGAVNVIGFYTGYEVSEHTVGQQVSAWGCKRAVHFLTATNHASIFERIMAVQCEIGLSWAAYHAVSIKQFDIEHAASGWMTTDYDISDPSNVAQGDITWHAVLSGTGPVSTFTKDGGALLHLTKLGGPDAGTLLAEKLYSPASNSTIATRTSATPGDADATNLAVSFRAPTSGNVYVVLECLANVTLAGQSIWWGLRENTTDLTFAGGGTKMYVSDADAAIRYHVTIHISGLTPGSAYTYKWAISSSQGSPSTTNLFAGDGGNGTAIMQVFAAP